jgi:hypothetical protein
MDSENSPKSLFVTSRENELSSVGLNKVHALHMIEQEWNNMSPFAKEKWVVMSNQMKETAPPAVEELLKRARALEEENAKLKEEIARFKRLLGYLSEGEGEPDEQEEEGEPGYEMVVEPVVVEPVVVEPVVVEPVVVEELEPVLVEELEPANEGKKVGNMNMLIECYYKGKQAYKIVQLFVSKGFMPLEGKFIKEKAGVKNISNFTAWGPHNKYKLLTKDGSMYTLDEEARKCILG